MSTPGQSVPRIPGDIEIVADFVEPCSHCGIACTGTFRLWYVEGGKRMTFEVDRPTLWEILEATIGAAFEQGRYESLPAFIRDWNECTGWQAQGLDEATPADTADMLAAVEALNAHDPRRDARLTSMLAALHDFVVRGAREHRELWLGET